MKKPKLIIGKKQIIISSLVLILGAAVYLNWQFAAGDNAIAVMDILNPKKDNPDSNKEIQETSNYGEAELTTANQTNISKEPSSNNEIDAKNNIEQLKFDRQKNRNDSIDTLTSVINSSESSADDKANANAQILKLTESSEKETKIESDVKAAIPECECIVNIEPNTANVTIAKQGNDPTEEEITKIKDIVTRTAGISPQNLVITPAKISKT